MTGTLYIGDLNSEKYWRDLNLASLPSIADSSSTGIILSMDELLFPYCQKEDVLITRFAFDRALKDYLETAGFEFRCNRNDYNTSKDDENRTIFEIISSDEEKLKRCISDIKGCTSCSPYSVVPYFDVLTDKADLGHNCSSFETVKKVNSKEYSANLSKRMGCGSHCKIVHGSDELLKKGKDLLKKGNFLIKDLFGVSGKGNILINSSALLERIVKHIESREAKGNVCTFVIEQFFDKELDFSCGFILRDDGSKEIVSIQKIINRQFSYGGSEASDEEFINYLYEKKYFEVIDTISNELYKDGYIGEVCVDSMLLKSGEIIPIIEINARKSMGFINNKIDSRLSPYGLKGNLTSIDIGIPDTLEFKDILDMLNNKGVLYLPGKESGVILLSSNTVFINRNLSSKRSKDQIYKGRLYFSVVSKDAEEKKRQFTSLVSALSELSCRIYSSI
ncbi:MAG TPA: hypothetical protein VF941_02700 [Clostridia bacterium]